MAMRTSLNMLIALALTRARLRLVAVIFSLLLCEGFSSLTRSARFATNF